MTSIRGTEEDRTRRRLLKPHGQERNTWKARTSVSDYEDQLAEDMARLEAAGWAKALAASSVLLPSLAKNHEEHRVEKDEKRGFEEVG